MNALADIAGRMIANGYDPVPVVGKAAIAPGWRAPGRITRERFAVSLESCPNATGVGARTGFLVGVDVDIEDAAHAGEIEEIAALHLGPTPSRRVGRKGCILAYRNETPISKVSINAGDKRLVEVLGDGQQFVAFGTHPDTRQPYQWTGKGDPWSTPLAELPAVTPKEIEAFVTAARQYLAGAGYPLAEVRTRNNPTPTAPDGRPSSRQICEAMIRCVSPDAREDWLKLGRPRTCTRPRLVDG